MNRFRLGIWMLAAAAVATMGAGEADAQMYGGLWYGPGHHYSGFYAGSYLPGAYYAGGYYPGSYAVGGYYGSPYRGVGTAYVNNYGTYTAVNTTASTTYGIGNLGYGTSYGLGSYGYGSPTVVGPSPLYGTSTTIIRGGPTGGVVQYSTNGDGYTYIPDSTYPTVIQNQPTLGLSRTYVPPTPNPVVVESRPPGTSTSLYTNNSPSQISSATRSYGTIKLSLPRTAAGALTYSLNGHLYTIQPGYSQTFRDDRQWTIEFKRGAVGSEVVRAPLKAGNYMFGVGVQGWELQQADPAANSLVPPPPAPGIAIPSLPALSDSPSRPTSSGPPTPLPPP